MQTISIVRKKNNVIKLFDLIEKVSMRNYNFELNKKYCITKKD